MSASYESWFGLSCINTIIYRCDHLSIRTLIDTIVRATIGNDR
ncbi:MAG: hypothetical protein BSOLF_0442 [Candidatus Carbobacillus altaicus]|uniref:Uncharacterized protein n=1 Tax=Candidatus Carbonibacillus altaicus TaxID=2163959 RepID=A0A2R6Y5I0_9BACL|nr:MAG: hypothetical protein BSOLF_0442 [Candidatus Carbobacillus altaicus]